MRSGSGKRHSRKKILFYWKKLNGMSGPKSSRYTLTAAQRRILEEQRRSGRRKKNLNCSGKKSNRLHGAITASWKPICIPALRRHFRNSRIPWRKMRRRIRARQIKFWRNWKPYWMRRPKFRTVSLKGLSVQKRCWQNGTMRHSGKISRYVGNTRVYSVVNGKYLK